MERLRRSPHHVSHVGAGAKSFAQSWLEFRAGMGPPATLSRWPLTWRGSVFGFTRREFAGSTETLPQPPSERKDIPTMGDFGSETSSNLSNGCSGATRKAALPLWSEHGLTHRNLGLARRRRFSRRRPASRTHFAFPGRCDDVRLALVAPRIAELRRFNPGGLLFNVGLISGDKPALTNSAEFDRFWGRSEDRIRPGFTW